MGLKVPKVLLANIEIELDCKILSYIILGSGEHNINYLLKSSKGPFVLRIYANTQFDNALKEYKILKKLDGKFSPKVLYLDMSKRFIKQNYMIQEFIEGKTLQKFDKKSIVKAANLLKEVHKIVDLRTKRSWKNLITFWTENNILKNSKFLGDTFNEEIKSLHSKVIQKLTEIIPLVSKYERTSLTHDDIVPENFIEKKNGELVLIDWELACFDYFFFDFGSILAESNLSKDLEDLFLKTYGFGRDSSEKKIIKAVNCSRILSLIGWLIERIALNMQGKRSFALEDINKYKRKLKKELVHLETLLSK